MKMLPGGSIEKKFQCPGHTAGADDNPGFLRPGKPQRLPEALSHLSKFLISPDRHFSKSIEKPIAKPIGHIFYV
jgi:hypothetical protein